MNRKKPDSCCQGSCHLNKQLEEEEKNEKTPSVPDLKSKFEFMPFTLLDKQALFVPAKQREHYFIYITAAYSITRAAVFHPPDSFFS